MINHEENYSLQLQNIKSNCHEQVIEYNDHSLPVTQYGNWCEVLNENDLRVVMENDFFCGMVNRKFRMIYDHCP